ncbi:hypothetical protein EDC04DRAFT_2656578 [Pisolithus marmoratus]|nr:hypothetical protein EDC04DRAFT_2656578 [Pisolithus marmoratus]
MLPITTTISTVFYVPVAFCTQPDICALYLFYCDILIAGLVIIDSGCKFITRQAVSDLICADTLLLKCTPPHSRQRVLNVRAKFSHELQYPGSADGLEVPLSRFEIRQQRT